MPLNLIDKITCKMDHAGTWTVCSMKPNKTNTLWYQVQYWTAVQNFTSRGTRNTYYTVSKNDTYVACYNFNAHQPILVIFGRHFADWVHYRMVIFLSHLCWLMSPHYPRKHKSWKLGLFGHAAYLKWHCFGLLYLRYSSTNFNNFSMVISMQLQLA